LSNASYLI